MEDKGLPDFSGKVVALYISNAPRGCEDGVVLEYPSFEKRSERIFVCGRIPEVEGQEWVSNLQAAVDWESVVHYLIFNSIEDYRKRVISFKPSLFEKITGKQH
jgi:hypothetical protein